MLNIGIAKLKPSRLQLNGATLGQSHSEQVTKLLHEGRCGELQLVFLNFAGIQTASPSYLKRLLGPFFAPSGGPVTIEAEVCPVAINVDSADLKEDLQTYLSAKGAALVVAEVLRGEAKFTQLLGVLDKAAEQTFAELQKLKKATAAQLYERHPGQTSNQTAWNNRLAQLVDMRVARRSRHGRFWVYQPTVPS